MGACSSNRGVLKMECGVQKKNGVQTTEYGRKNGVWSTKKRYGVGTEKFSVLWSVTHFSSVLCTPVPNSIINSNSYSRPSPNPQTPEWNQFVLRPIPQAGHYKIMFVFIFLPSNILIISNQQFNILIFNFNFCKIGI